MAMSALHAAATVAAVGCCGERASAMGTTSNTTNKLVSFQSSSIFAEGGVKKRWANDGRLEKRLSGTGTSKLRRADVNSVLADTPGELLKLQEHVLKERVANPKNVASLILGGGAGARLFPLTRARAKPAVSIGGSYRLIDVAVSNCINSGINKVYILTQYNSHSLNNHINRAYNSPGRIGFGDGFVEVLAAMQTAGKPGQGWFQGTADAVRQFLWIFEDAKFSHIDNILILAGDHLYRMDYVQFLQKHVESEADVTVACVPVDESSASDFGLFKIDKSGRIRQFFEKPKGDALKAMQVEPSIVGLSAEEAEKSPYIATMGIYAFKTSVLQKLLSRSYPSANDFRSEVIPMAAKDVVVKAYVFKGYWQDIGTIRSFFDANLELTRQPSKFELYDHLKPIYTSPRFLPPTHYESCKISSSIISHGCFLERCKVEHSIIGVRSRLECGVELKDTMMMGADYYETDDEIESILAKGEVPLGVGRDTKIRNCIIEKNARIGRNVVITNADNVQEAERPSEGLYIRSGITIILKNVTIPHGTII